MPIGHQARDARALKDAPDLRAQITLSRSERLWSRFLWMLTFPREGADPHQTPFNHIALLNLYDKGDLSGYATGFFLKPDLLVTAAHNFLLVEFDAIGVFPAYDAKLNDSRAISGVAYAYDERRDCGVVVLGSAAQGMSETGASASGPARLAGYAFPYINGAPRMTYGDGDCQIIGQEAQYKITVRQGDSGAPVWGRQPGGSLLAVHSQTRDQGGGAIGIGEVFDEDLKQLVESLEREARAKRN